MTKAALQEYVVPAEACPAEPLPGQYFCSPSGQTTLLVSRVAKVREDTRNGLRYRLYCLRLRKAVMPPDITPLPFPRQQKAERQPRVAPCLREHGGIITPAAARKAERTRVIALRKSYADPDNALVEPIRRQNGSAVPSTWTDPSDVNPLRKTARVVHSFRNNARDQVQILPKAHAKAAMRLRQSYILGEIGVGRGIDWGSSPSGNYESGGPSDGRLDHLKKFNAAMNYLGRLSEITRCIILNEEGLGSYATRTGINRMVVTGRLIAAMDVLQDHWDLVDDANPDRQRHTIGSQTGPATYVEPAAPGGAVKWAAD